MSHAPFSLFHHSVLIWFGSFSVMMRCTDKEASMRAKQLSCFNNNKIQGEDLAAVNCIWAPNRVASDGVHSKTVDLLFIHSYLLLLSLSMFVALLFLSSYLIMQFFLAITPQRESWFALHILSSYWHVIVSVVSLSHVALSCSAVNRNCLGQFRGIRPRMYIEGLLNVTLT